MTLLGFDTATEDTAVCAWRDGEVIQESLLGLSEDGSPGHTTRLLGEVERVVEAAGGWPAIDSIAVGVGPGSFTGLRVGIASARGLAAARALPLAGVCTLDALARGIEAGPGRRRLAVIDARRGEVVAALYEDTGERVWEPWVGDPDALCKRLAGLPETPLAAGSGALRFSGELASCGVEVAGDDDLHRVAARHVCELAAAAGASRDGAPQPIYLRQPDAERWHERDHPQKSSR